MNGVWKSGPPPCDGEYISRSRNGSGTRYLEVRRKFADGCWVNEYEPRYTLDFQRVVEWLDETPQWIECKGGERPVPPHAKTEVMYRSGEQGAFEAPAFVRQWAHHQAGDDIVAYRLSKPSKPVEDDSAKASGETAACLPFECSGLSVEKTVAITCTDLRSYTSALDWRPAAHSVAAAQAPIAATHGTETLPATPPDAAAPSCKTISDRRGIEERRIAETQPGGEKPSRPNVPKRVCMDDWRERLREFVNATDRSDPKQWEAVMRVAADMLRELLDIHLVNTQRRGLEAGAESPKLYSEWSHESHLKALDAS